MIVADEAIGNIEEWAMLMLNATLTEPDAPISCPQTKATDVEGPDLVRLEGIRCQLDIMRDELVPAGSSLAVKLAAEAVLFSWVEHWTLSTMGAGTLFDKESPTMTRRRTAALKRYLMALRNHAQLSRLERSIRQRTIYVEASADGMFRPVS